jgi:hypothetical protein
VRLAWVRHQRDEHTSGYDRDVPRIWLVTLVILVACLVASMVIATVKLA